ncbi:hypothetical protein G6F68_018001 [Rhizopus microsporus]|nr:hypothetical protein G6F68_018001 [Rhizopus microsporus]
MEKAYKEEITTFNNKPPVYLGRPQQMKRSLDVTNTFPPHHPLANLSSPFQQQQQARLQYYHHRPPVYVEKPSFGLRDFELQDTLGELDDVL